MPKLFTPKGDAVSSPRQPQLRVANSAYRKILLKRIAAILGYSVIGVFIVYLCFAATIMRAVPTISGSGLVLVKENTFHGGSIPANVSILIDTKAEQKNDYVERLKQAFVPSKNAAVVKVVAGPNNSISWVASGLVTVDGVLTDVHLAEQPLNDANTAKTKLRGEYLTVCVSGDCIPGDGIIVSQKNIYGLTLHKYASSDAGTSIKGEK
jgi:hypothetical protein